MQSWGQQGAWHQSVQASRGGVNQEIDATRKQSISVALVAATRTITNDGDIDSQQ
jgi:hypothetical protein